MRRPGLAARVLVLCALRVACSNYYDLPVEVHLWDDTRQAPLDRMVDVTNQFGLKVLFEHSYLNENNVAFSPYGLVGILVALFEGVDGDSSYQIQRSMELPWNRDVLRIGFRDIHRTLKTYFVPEEGFLTGLALNKENVTFKEEYRKIIRFYGFDLEEDRLPKFPLNASASTKKPDIASESTTNANLETSAPGTTAGATMVNSEPAPREPDAAVDTGSSTTMNVMPAEELTTRTPDTSSMAPPENSNTSPLNDGDMSTSSVPSSIQDPTEPNLMTSSIISMSTPSENRDSTTGVSISSDVELITPTTVDMSTSASEMAIAGTNAPSSAEPAAEGMGSSLGTDSTTAEPTTSSSTLETLTRKKKSISNHPIKPHVLRERHIDEIGYPVVFDAPTTREPMFLANGLKNIEVPYMVYDTWLDHSYLPQLQASAVRLPLDTERYYLLVILPERARDLPHLSKRLALQYSLRNICTTLRPRRVRACVPTFTVSGFVTLTTDLQRLGIRDVFERRQDDFTPMTSQRGVYVRNVEQAITVTIRKYEKEIPHQIKYSFSQPPVHFSATHPFLYFVMDSSIHVSLMAGKIIDPLNTRVI